MSYWVVANEKMQAATAQWWTCLKTETSRASWRKASKYLVFHLESRELSGTGSAVPLGEPTKYAARASETVQSKFECAFKTVLLHDGLLMMSQLAASALSCHGCPPTVNLFQI